MDEEFATRSLQYWRVNQCENAVTTMGADKSGERVPVVAVAVAGGSAGPEAAAATPAQQSSDNRSDTKTTS